MANKKYEWAKPLLGDDQDIESITSPATQYEWAQPLFEDVERQKRYKEAITSPTTSTYELAKSLFEGVEGKTSAPTITTTPTPKPTVTPTIRSTPEFGYINNNLKDTTTNGIDKLKQTLGIIDVSNSENMINSLRDTFGPLQPEEKDQGSISNWDSVYNSMSPLAKLKYNISKVPDKIGDFAKTLGGGVASKFFGNELTNLGTRVLYNDWTKNFEKTPNSMKPATVLTPEDDAEIENYLNQSNITGTERVKAKKDITNQLKAYKQQKLYDDILKDWTGNDNQSQSKAFGWGQSIGGFGKMTALTELTGGMPFAGGFLTGVVDSYGAGGTAEDMLKSGIQLGTFNKVGAIASKGVGGLAGKLIGKTPLKNTLTGNFIGKYAGGAAFGTAGTATYFLTRDEKPTAKEFVNNALIMGLFEAVPSTISAGLNAKNTKTSVYKVMERYEKEMKNSYKAAKTAKTPEETLKIFDNMINYNQKSMDTLNKADLPGAKDIVNKSLQGMYIIDDILAKEKGLISQVNQKFPTGIEGNVKSASKPIPTINGLLNSPIEVPEMGSTQQSGIIPKVGNPQNGDVIKTGTKVTILDNGKPIDVTISEVEKNVVTYVTPGGGIKRVLKKYFENSIEKASKSVQQSSEPQKDLGNVITPTETTIASSGKNDVLDTNDDLFNKAKDLFDGGINPTIKNIQKNFDIERGTAADIVKRYKDSLKPKTPMADRTFDNARKDEINAYQFDNPEVQNEIQAYANYIKNYEFISSKNPSESTSEVMKKLKAATNVTYDKIEAAIDDIINNRGSENHATAKRVEMVIDEMLTNGFDTIDGQHFPPDKGYIQKKSAIEGKEINPTGSNQLSGDDLPLPDIDTSTEVKHENSTKVEPDKVESKPLKELTVGDKVGIKDFHGVPQQTVEIISDNNVTWKIKLPDGKHTSISKKVMEATRIKDQSPEVPTEPKKETSDVEPKEPMGTTKGPKESEGTKTEPDKTIETKEPEKVESKEPLKELTIGDKVKIRNFLGKPEQTVEIIEDNKGTWKIKLSNGNTVPIGKKALEKMRVNDEGITTPEKVSKKESDNLENTCNNCKHSVDYGDSVDYIYCEKGKRKKDVKKTDTCDDFVSSTQNQINVNDINYDTFKIDANNMNKLAPLFIEELNKYDDNDYVTIVTQTLSGNIKRQKVQVKQAKETFKNPKMTDLVISSSKMRLKPYLGDIKTGEPFEAEMYQGKGNKDIYTYVEYPILGKGQYYTFDKKTAQQYGEVTEHKITLKNPLIIRDDTDWRKLTKESGWDYPNPYGGEKEAIIKDIDRLKELVLSQNHDGIIVMFENDTSGDFNEKTQNPIKTISNVLGHDQVVKYDEVQPAGEAPEKITPEEKPAEIIKPHDKIATELLDNYIRKGVKLTSSNLFEIADKAYGGTQAEDKYTVKDAFDAMELAVNKFLMEIPADKTGNYPADKAVETIEYLQKVLEKLPTQNNRTDEMDKYQQFSTPPTIAFVANWVARTTKNDVVLEPSAGIGGLATFAKRNGAEVVVNELSQRRLEVLKSMKFDKYFNKDAEQIDNVLPEDIKPTVVLMNPPFSSAAERMGNKTSTKNAIRHIEQALNRLEDGGRLVAIVGKGMADEAPAFKDWWNKLKSKYNIKANVGIAGSNYKKYGTTFGIQLVVIDKTGPTVEKTLTGEYKDLTELPKVLEGIRNERQSLDDKPTSVVQGSKKTPAESGQQQLVPEPSNTRGDKDSGLSDTGGRGNVPNGNRDSSGEVTSGGIQDVNTTIRDTKPTKEGAGQPGQVVESDTGSGGEPQREPVREPVQTEGSGDTGIKDTEVKQEKSGIKIEKSSDKVAVENESDVYAVYQPKKLKIKGAKPHVTDLVESAAMSAIDPPNISYTPNLPKEISEKGILSLPQLETVAYAGQAHNTVMENGKRRGFFLGDGTGVGKGRQISGVILDNWRQGRKKAVWVSVNPDLYIDAIRDWTALGGKKTDVINTRKVKIENKIPNKEGILFLGYDTLKVSNRSGNAIRNGAEYPRVDQIIEWLGKDFDGVIVFDEAHKMGNAVESGEGLNKKKPTARALAGMNLQNSLPNARVLYASATGATEVHNLAYADRLGLWGEGTPFRTVKDFIGSISSGGLAAMELVARDMKAMGAYLARSISFKGVDYDMLEHELTPVQETIYDTMSRAWQKILHNMTDALEITGQNKNGRAKGAAKSAFYGSMQRFYNQIITSMAMPSVIKDIEKELKAGNSAVIQLVNTNESSMNRQLSKAQDEGTDLEDLDLTPADTVIEYLLKSFPVQEYEEYVDENGNKKTRPVFDPSTGKPVISREAVRMRDKIIEEIKQMKVPDGPLEILYDTFGVENVAEITGRSRRVVTKTDPKTGERKRVVENWSKSKGLADVDQFMNGPKRILIFSDAGGTGKSYHSDKNVKNQSKRIHYLLQPGWNAFNATQGFGRTHRTNQAVTPTFRLVTTNVRGQKRFISTIARRLDQLGALTKGQRQAGSGVFGEKDNLENALAIDTLQIFYRQLFNNQISGLPSDGQGIIEKMGLSDKLVNKENGSFIDDQDVTRNMSMFLNRILALEVKEQNQLFDLFYNTYLDNFNKAMEDGTLDVGLENYPAEKIVLNDERVIRTDENSGAETKYVNLTAYKKPVIMDFHNIQLLRNGFQDLVKIKDTGEVKAVFRVGTKTLKDGDIVNRYRLSGPILGKESEYIQSTLDEKTTKINEKEWKKAWSDEIAKQPEFTEETLHLLTGSLLPIWNKISKGRVRVVRIVDDKGQQWLGRLVPEGDIYSTLQDLGLGVKKPTYTPEQIQDMVLNKNKVIYLEDDRVKIFRSRVSGENRIEITGTNVWFYRQYGVMFERINFKDRHFIPIGEKGKGIIERIIKDNPVTTVGSNKKSDSDSDSDVENLTSTATGPRLGKATGQNTTGKAKRASEIFKEFAEKLDATIKRNPNRGTLGTFNNVTHIIRIKKANDLAVLSHETGHMFDKMYKFSEIKDKSIQNELKSLGLVTSPPSYSATRVRREGVAEFVRLYLTDESAAINQAPNFTLEFEKTMPPEILKILKDLRKDIWDLTNLDPVSRVKRSIRFKGDKEAKQPFDAMAILRKTYTGMVDSNYPVEWAAGELKGKAAKTTVHNKVAAIRGYEGIALFNINPKGEDGYYQTNLKGVNVGDSYSEITKKIHEDEDTRRDFWAYAVSRRAVDYFARNLEMPDTLETYMETMKKLEQQYPEFPAIFDELQTYRHNNAMLLVESGVYSKDKLDDIEASNPNYVPLKRIMEAFDNVAGSSNKLSGSKKVIKRLRGGGEDIDDPEVSDINNTFIYRSVAMRNDLLRVIADMADSVEGKGSIMARSPIKLKAIQFNLEKVKKQLEDIGVDADGIDLDVMARIFQPNYLAGPNQLIVYRNGDPVLYDVHPELYDAVKGLQYESMGKLIEIMMSVSQIQKAGIIFTPKYITYNAARDTFHNLVASETNITPLDILKGFWDVSTGDKSYKFAMRKGGTTNFFSSNDRKFAEEAIDDIMAGQTKAKQFSYKIKHPFRTIQDFIEPTELAGRVAEMKKYLKKTGCSEKDVEQAIANMRDLSVDFRRMGLWIKKLNANRWVNFLNTNIQGIDKFVRLWKNHFLRTLIKGFLYMTLPTLFLMWLCKDNDYYKEELPRWRKDFFWNIPFGDPSTTKIFIPIPRPWEMGIVFCAVPERAIESLFKHNPTAWDEFSTSLEQTFVPEFIPSPIQPLLQDAIGKDWRGISILSESDKRLSPEHPELQYNDYTNEIAKGIAYSLKDLPLPEWVKSPKRLEKIIEGYSGTLGSIAMDSFDQVTGKKEGVPVVGGLFNNFIVDAERSPTSVNDFYRYKAILESKYQAEMRTKNKEEIDTLLKSTRNSYLSAADAISKLQNVISIIDDGSAPDKKIRKAAIKQEITSIAKGMTKLYEDLYR